MAAGLPTEGTKAALLRAGGVARRDVPTCHLDERLSDVQERVAGAGWDACVVVNSERVVFGLLRAAELQGDPALRIDEVMRPGPSTFRPFEEIEKIAKVMADRNRESIPITTSDGRLVGLLLRADVRVN